MLNTRFVVLLFIALLFFIKYIYLIAYVVDRFLSQGFMNFTPTSTRFYVSLSETLDSCLMSQTKFCQIFKGCLATSTEALGRSVRAFLNTGYPFSRKRGFLHRDAEIEKCQTKKQPYINLGCST